MSPTVKAKRIGRSDVAIFVSGRVEKSAAESVAWVADNMLHQTDARPERVEFDLSQVTGVDRVGFASLVDVAVGASAAGIAVVVRCGGYCALLEGYQAGRLSTSEKLGRVLRRHLMPVRAKRTLPAGVERRRVRWCPGPIARYPQV